MHTPVLLQQAIERLNIRKGGLYIDATFGEGGDSEAIINKGGKVLAIDLDINQLKKIGYPELFSGSEKEMPKQVRHDIIPVQGNFAEIEKIAKVNGFFPVEGVIFDLGLSMKQIKESKKGFSYKRAEELLDMRLNSESDESAADFLNSADEKEIYEIFAKYGEDINSAAIAKNIFIGRRMKKFERVEDLLRVIDRTMGIKDQRTYSRIFQALRIKVNGEFENLKKGLRGAVNILKKDGRIVVISFHSLEDRIVKNFVRENNLKFFDKKPIRGIRQYERSAKLRTIINL